MASGTLTEAFGVQSECNGQYNVDSLPLGSSLLYHIPNHNVVQGFIWEGEGFAPPI